MDRRRRIGFVLVAALASLVATEAAWATHVKGHPGGNAAVAQYVEQVPTSSGNQATGVGTITKTTLPPAVEQKLESEAGNDAALLKEVSTSSQYGAPQKTLRNKKRSGGTTAIPKEIEDTSATKALSAVRTVVTDGSEGRLIALLVVLLAITGFAVAAAGYRQRALRRPVGR